MLPATRAFKIPEPLAWFANLLGIAYVILTTVLFVFPPELPVTGSNMNYCIVAFAIVLIISIIQWIVDGRKNYKGPQVDLDDVVLTAAETQDNTGPKRVAGNGNQSTSDSDLAQKAKHV